MKPEEIKAVIHRKGFTIQMIGETLQTTPTSVGAVINRATTSKRIATAVAKIVGKPLAEVFPDVEAYFAAERKRQLKIAKQAELQQLLAG